MAKSKQAIANEAYRDRVMKKIIKLLQENDEDVLQIASNKICFPFVCPDETIATDEWLQITLSIPRGSRKDNEPFDGYEQAEDFQKKQEANAKREAEAEAKKQRKIAFDTKKREIAKKGVEG